jgi:hypothetical protein
MSIADKRVEELLDRWMASLELHARYRKLDDTAYARVQNWPPHQRPTAWVIELARKRLLELRGQLTQRKDAGDTAFAESLELMSFLTSLLGSEHIDRFIPLATAKAVDTAASGTVVQPKTRAPARPRAATGQSVVHRQLASQKPATSAKQAPAQRAPGSTKATSPVDARTRQVLTDAVRLLEWGREWPAIAGLIARMANRPSEKDVWQILRAHRAEILAKAGRPAS